MLRNSLQSEQTLPSASNGRLITSCSAFHSDRRARSSAPGTERLQSFPLFSSCRPPLLARPGHGSSLPGRHRVSTALRLAAQSSHSTGKGRRSPETARATGPPRCRGLRQPRSPARGNNAATDRSWSVGDRSAPSHPALVLAWDWRQQAWRNSLDSLSPTGSQPGQWTAMSSGDVWPEMAAPPGRCRSALQRLAPS